MITTSQMAREGSTRTHRRSSVAEPHHPGSHHANNPERLASWRRSTRTTCRSSHLLEKLRSTADGGTLLTTDTPGRQWMGIRTSTITATFRLSWREAASAA